MNAPPADLDTDTLATAVARSWGVRLEALRYLPVGFGAHHWRGAAASGDRFFLTVDDLAAPARGVADPGRVFDALRRAYSVAADLRSAAALSFVAAPLLGRGAAAAHRLTARYAVSLQPWIDGRSAPFGATRTPLERERMATILGRLHRATAHLAGTGRTLPARDTLALQARPALEQALRDVDRPWTSGPLAERARALVRPRCRDLAGRLRAYDAEARRVAYEAAHWVVTHGEPHPGNVLDTEAGPMLLDWDTILLAPAERDLHGILGRGGAGGAGSGGEARGGRADVQDAAVARAYRASAGARRIDEGTLRFYRERWALTDVSTAVAALRAEHDRDADTELALAILRTTLAP